jgi:hypothetical protein
LVNRDTSDYLVAVTGISLLRGGQQVWTGENVQIKKAYVSRTYERRFSTGRTLVLSAIGAGLIGAFVSQTLIGQGMENTAQTGDTAQLLRTPAGRHQLPRLNSRRSRFYFGLRLGLP